jgi:hypothetical protein
MPDLHRLFGFKSNQLWIFESLNRLEDRFNFASLSQSEVETTSNRSQLRAKL